LWWWIKRVIVDEELEPQTKRKVLKDLELMSIDALHEYIVELNAEMPRKPLRVPQKVSSGYSCSWHKIQDKG
jgi:uncharacterized small protein (DUF1192 family)